MECPFSWCLNSVEYIVFPEHGHPADQAESCGEHLALAIEAASSLSEPVNRWEVQRA